MRHDSQARSAEALVEREVEGMHEVVEAVRPVVRRLTRDPWRCRSRGEAIAQRYGKPPWWWRMRLAEWAGFKAGHASCPRESLRAFRLFLHTMSDRELLAFVDELLQRPSAGRKSA